MIAFLKNLLVLAVITTILVGVGVAMSFWLPWNWLTYFFVLIRRFGMMFNFFWDMDTTFYLVGISLLIESIVWVYYSALYIIKVSGLNKS